MAIDTTVGGASSNSYATVDEADLYFESRLHSESWEPLELTDKKEIALITATKILERYVDWRFQSATSTQALSCPFNGAYDRLSRAISSQVIPVQVKEATYEVAYSIIDEDRTLENDLAGISDIKIGSLSITADKYDRKDVIPPVVWQILDSLGSPIKLGKQQSYIEFGRG